MMINPSPRELAEEALAALHEPPMTPHEHFEFLIQQGIIDRNGREIGRHLGAVKWDSPQVMERLQQAMTAE